MAQGMTTRAVGLIAGTIVAIVMALIGRAVFSALAPKCHD
jgi:tetrahydromethanopterin S-methyltransferase subunit F